MTIVRQHQETKGFLHKITFTTLAEYLHILHVLTESALAPLGSKAMLYLAAAVSDFYIPSANMVCRIDYRRVILNPFTKSYNDYRKLIRSRRLMVLLVSSWNWCRKCCVHSSNSGARKLLWFHLKWAKVSSFYGRRIQFLLDQIEFPSPQATLYWVRHRKA